VRPGIYGKFMLVAWQSRRIACVPDPEPRDSLGGYRFRLIWPIHGGWRNARLTGISTTDHVGDPFCSLQQSFVREVGVALRGARVRVPEQPLHDVERDPLVHQEARVGVPQIVQPDIGEAGALADAVPGEEQRGRRLAVGEGKMNGLPSWRGMARRSTSAWPFSAVARGLPDFESRAACAVPS